MNIIIPQNIYATLFALSLTDKQKENLIIKESALITKELENNKDAVGLIPSLDLLSKPDLFVSNKLAISFDGILSNSYLYFVPEQTTFNKVLLRGDIASNDLILSKILFPEQYGIEPELALDANPIDFENNNYLIIGIENELNPITKNGISFSDHVAELIDYPYVNFVLASYNQESLKQFEQESQGLAELINNNIKDSVAKLQLDAKLNNFIVENIDSVYFDFTENEKEALVELLKLPYYHGITKDLVEVKYA